MTEPERAETPPPTDTPAPPRRWRKFMTLGVAGFTLSITLAAINVFYALRGSVMVIRPAQQVLLYRDGEGDSAILVAVTRLAMVNTADSANGDVLMEAVLRPEPGAPGFAATGTVTTAFTPDAKAAAEKCELGARCVPLSGLLVMEKGDQLLDIPGGSVRDLYLSFPLANWNCNGAAPACARYGNFGQAAGALAGRPLAFTVSLKFYGDGSRELDCAAKPVDATYLARNGWTALNCDVTKVRGGPVL